MSSTKSNRSDTHSGESSVNSLSTVVSRENHYNEYPKVHKDSMGMCPECLYSVWNISFGVFLLFTTVFMQPGNAPAVITQCFAVAYVFAGLLSFVIIFKVARSIFVVLAVFSLGTTILTTLTIIGFVYTIDGQIPVPEMMMRNVYLEFVLGGLLCIHLAINIFSFFIFTIRSCKSSEDLNNEYSHRSIRGAAAETEEKGSREIIVMDY